MAAVFDKGLYEGECIAQFMGQSDNDKKTPYFAMRFNILGRITKENTLAACPEGERTVYLYLSDAAIDIAAEVLTHLGYPHESLRFLDPSSESHYSFIGKKADLWCKIESYNGSTKEKWAVSMPREIKPVTPIDNSELRRLDAMFGKALKAKPPTSPPAKQSEPKPAPAAAEPHPASAAAHADDIPF